MESEYAIYRGDHLEKNAVWVGSIAGFDRAVEMMNRLAEHLPGSYFVFSPVSQSIVAVWEKDHKPAEPGKHRPQPENRTPQPHNSGGPMPSTKEPFGASIASFDIFCGYYRDKDAVWIEAVEGLRQARGRMQQIAAQKPGHYFLYSAMDRLVVAIVNAEEDLAASSEKNLNRPSAKHKTAGAA